MKETLKSKKGITLIALVITIIVLIILAGISISMLVGTDGIITKAKQGRQNMQNAAIEEQERLNTLYAEFESGVVGTGSYDAIDGLINFKRIIASAITTAGVETSENDDAETMADNIAQIAEQAASNVNATPDWAIPFSCGSKGGSSSSYSYTVNFDSGYIIYSNLGGAGTGYVKINNVEPTTDDTINYHTDNTNVKIAKVTNGDVITVYANYDSAYNYRYVSGYIIKTDKTISDAYLFGNYHRGEGSWTETIDMDGIVFSSNHSTGNITQNGTSMTGVLNNNGKPLDEMFCTSGTVFKAYSGDELKYTYSYSAYDCNTAAFAVIDFE